MNRNFLKSIFYPVLIGDVGLLLFLHERLIPIMDTLVKHGDEEIVFGVTTNEVTAGALVFLAFLSQAICWYFLTHSEHRLWKYPENMDAGWVIRAVCLCVVAIIPLFEAGLTFKLFLGEKTNAFAAVRQSAPSNIDMMINVTIAALVGLISTVLAWLTGASMAMRTEQRDEAEAVALELLEDDEPVEESRMNGGQVGKPQLTNGRAKDRRADKDHPLEPAE